MASEKWTYFYSDWPEIFCDKCKVNRYAIGQNDIEILLACEHIVPRLYDPDSLEGILAEADIVRSIVYELFGEDDPVIKEHK